MDQVGSAYGVDSLLSAGQNGTGETIGLYEPAQASASDINTYKSCFGLTNPFTVQNVDTGGPVDANGTVEADLDVEQVMTQAPKASVISYQGPNTAQGQFDIWNEIVSADAAQVVSTSWGMCEPQAEAAGLQAAFTALFQRASAQGQSIFAATGDSGSEACLPENGSTALAVQYPSSDPWVTAVGGTDLLDDSASDQTVWNSCQGDESLSCAESMNDEGAGTGGMSIYETPQSSQPHLYAWQTTEPCGTECREVPDISANAGVPMVIYVNGGWSEAGGTSFAAPFMGAMVADTDSSCGRIGLFTPFLYSLYSDGSYGTAFNDITEGDTDLTGSNDGDFPALTGYDAATGIGTPIAGGLTCTSVSAVSPGYAGAQVTVSGLGLEHADIYFGSAQATVVSASGTSATVVVPAGSGTVTVSATGIAGTASQTAPFTYGTAPAPPPAPAQHGYWLVGSDGGIFTFGSAQFYGSTGSLHLQRPVVGIVPTAAKTGYWLDASDGGVFAFNAGFYGSIPGLGIHPAGSGLSNSLDAPIVGMVPSADGGGYFMVASDGGVFAFGDAKFAGSCPGIGGCSGAAVAVMPDASGNGYWLVTQTGHVYTFGDAHYFGAPGPQSVPVTSAVRTPDGRGYWILFANGAVAPFGDAGNFGSPVGQMGGLNTASAIFTTSDGGGYWVASANGTVDNYGDAPNDGDLAGTKINAPIIAASGW
jgi:kumamolisin